MPNYNIGSQSDMRRLQRDIENDIKKHAKEAISEGAIPVECPQCRAKFNASPGISTCPKCGCKIDLQLNFHF